MSDKLRRGHTQGKGRLKSVEVGVEEKGRTPPNHVFVFFVV